MEPFLLNFCLLDLQCTSPYPNDTPLPVWLFRLGCTPYAVFTHLNNWLRFSNPITLLLLIVRFSNCSTRFSFDFSFTVLLVTLVNRKYISGSISGLPPFDTHIRLSTIEYRVSDSCLYSLGKPPLIVCKNVFAGYDTVASSSLPNNAMGSSM